jgi:hypothetical protein
VRNSSENDELSTTDCIQYTHDDSTVPPMYKNNLLRRMTSLIQTILDEHYSHSLLQSHHYIPCRHCLTCFIMRPILTKRTLMSDVQILIAISKCKDLESQNHIFSLSQLSEINEDEKLISEDLDGEICLFSYEECRTVAAREHSSLICPVGNVSVWLSYVAPDLPLTDIPRIKNLELIKKLGEGGFAVVYHGFIDIGQQIDADTDYSSFSSSSSYDYPPRPNSRSLTMSEPSTKESPTRNVMMSPVRGKKKSLFSPGASTRNSHEHTHEILSSPTQHGSHLIHRTSPRLLHASPHRSHVSHTHTSHTPQLSHTPYSPQTPHTSHSPHTPHTPHTTSYVPQISKTSPENSVSSHTSHTSPDTPQMIRQSHTPQTSPDTPHTSRQSLTLRTSQTSPDTPQMARQSHTPQTSPDTPHTSRQSPTLRTSQTSPESPHTSQQSHTPQRSQTSPDTPQMTRQLLTTRTSQDAPHTSRKSLRISQSSPDKPRTSRQSLCISQTSPESPQRARQSQISQTSHTSQISHTTHTTHSSRSSHTSSPDTPRRSRQLNGFLSSHLSPQTSPPTPPITPPAKGSPFLRAKSTVQQAVLMMGTRVAKQNPIMKRVDVAVKILKGNNTEAFDELLLEVNVMRNLNHTNLIHMYGICLSPSLGMVMEYVPESDLQRLLERKAKCVLVEEVKHPDLPIPLIPVGKECIILSEEEESVVVEVDFGNYTVPKSIIKISYRPVNDDDISWKLRLRITIDIAQGMNYLHSRTPPITHRDLRSPNVFLMSRNENAEVVAKVADFGLAVFSESGKLGKQLMTWQWLAPEVIAPNRMGYDCRSDVYSFGIVMYEIATRRYPYIEDYGESYRRGAGGIDQHGFIRDIANNDLRPIISESSVPLYCPSQEGWREYCLLMKECWAGNIGVYIFFYFF